MNRTLTRSSPTFTELFQRLLAVALLIVLPAVVSAAVDTKSDKPSVAESRFAKLDGNRVHYVNYGKGKEALIFIHGWTMNADNWRDQLPSFTNRYHVLVIDLPGHGQSDKPQITYSMEYFARAVDAVMQDAKVKRAVLVGHSMGTPVARQFYRKYPDKTLAIVIVDGSLRPFFDQPVIDRVLAGIRAPNYKQTVTQMFAGMYGTSLTPEAKERINSSAMNTPQYVLVGAMEGMTDNSIWTEDKIDLPVLAVMAKSPFFPPGIEGDFKRIAPKMEFYMWEGVGHFLMMERSKQFNETLLKFLEKNHLLQ